MDAIIPTILFLAQSSDPDAAAGLLMIPFMCFFYVFMILSYCMIPLLSIFSIVFWIMMLVDVVQRKFENDNDRVTWILIVALTGIIGAVIYYFMIKQKDTKK